MRERGKISRRAFLKTTAAGIGGMTLGLGGAAQGAQEKAKTPPGAKPAKKVLGVDVIKMGGAGGHFWGPRRLRLADPGGGNPGH